MRRGTGRLLAAWVISTGSVAWGLIGGLAGVAHADAGGQQCEPLTAASASSSSPSASPAQLCVSVEASQASIKRGQAALFDVQVFTQNGPASGVSVTLTAAPSGQVATFTARCPGGNGSATCAVGPLATSVAPAAYQMQAQITVPASASSSVTSVTLTAAADAAVSPALAAEPAASGSVAVTAVASASPSPSPSKTPSPSSLPPTSSPVAVVSPVASATLPTVLPPVVLPPTAAATSVLTPQNVTSDLPTITPVAVVPTPVTDSTGSPVADTGSPEAGSFTLAVNMSSATAQVFGIIVVALALTLAGTKLVADVFTTRRTTGPRPARTKAAHSKPTGGKPGDGTGGGGGAGGRTMFLRRSRPRPVAPGPGAGGPSAAPTQQIPGTLPEDIT